MHELGLSNNEKDILSTEMETISWEKLVHPIYIFNKLNIPIHSMAYSWKWDEFIVLIKKFYNFSLNEKLK
jgi:hypothetical protein